MKTKKYVPKPILEIDLDKISVMELIRKIEKRETEARYILMVIEAARARSLSK